jgi:hypothetical protein
MTTKQDAPGQPQPGEPMSPSQAQVSITVKSNAYREGLARKAAEERNNTK